MLEGGMNFGQLLTIIVSVGSLLITLYFNSKAVKDRKDNENMAIKEREKREAIVNERIISSVSGVKRELETFKCENKSLIISYRDDNRQLISDFKEEINKKLDKSNEDLNKRFEELSKALKDQQEITTKIREENVETKSSAKSAHKRLDDMVRLLSKREDG